MRKRLFEFCFGEMVLEMFTYSLRMDAVCKRQDNVVAKRLRPLQEKRR